MIGRRDVELVTARCRELPRATGDYLEPDFVMNLQATVVDYMMHTTAVVRALEHFKSERWDEVRTLDDLEAAMARFEDDKEGNTELAQYLWGYNMWTRAEQLRRLTEYFQSIGVVDQPSLRNWAEGAEFKTDFEGRVKGLGIAVFQWLVMRQGVETVKPDVHVRRFAESVLGRRLNDAEIVDVVTSAARELEIKAYELDWRIWEAQRSG